MKLDWWIVTVITSLLLFVRAEAVAAAASDSSRNLPHSPPYSETNPDNLSTSAKRNFNTDQPDHPLLTTLTTTKPKGSPGTSEDDRQSYIIAVTPESTIHDGVTANNSISSASNSTGLSWNGTVQLRGISIRFCPAWTCKNRCFQKSNNKVPVSESPKASHGVSESLSVSSVISESSTVPHGVFESSTGSYDVFESAIVFPAASESSTVTPGVDELPSVPPTVSSPEAEDSSTSSSNESETTATKCSCDHICIRLGDCCVDFFSLCLNITDEAEVIRLVEHAQYNTPTFGSVEDQYQLNVTQMMVSYGSCVTTPEGERYTMISSCPESFGDPTVVTTCREAEQHPTLQPHSDVDNMAVTFRNVDCARCHSYNLTRLVSWRHGVSCPNASSSGHDSFLKDVAAAIQSGNCSYIYRVPEHAQTQPRSCLPISAKLKTFDPGLETATDANVSHTYANVSKTDDVCTFEDLLLCKTYSYETLTSDDEVVKNPHCLKCMTGSTPISVDLPCGREKNENKEPPDPSKGQGGILALFTRDSSGISTIVVNGKKIPTSEIRCNDDEVFDYATFHCRTLFCPMGYRPIRGQCSLVDHYMVPPKSQMVPSGTETVYVTFNLKDDVSGKSQELEGTFRRAFQDAHNHLAVPAISFSCIPNQCDSHNLPGTNSSEFAGYSVSVTVSPVSNLSKVLDSINYALKTTDFVTGFVVRNYDTDPKPECTTGRPDLIYHTNVSQIDGNLFVDASHGPLTLFYPLTNTFFRIDLTKSNTSKQTVQPVYMSLVCVQPQINSTLNCPSVPFNISQTRLENGTLFIKDTDLSYPEHQYELHGHFVLVCSDFENLNDLKFFHFSDPQYYLSWACSLTSVVFLATSLVGFALLPYLKTLVGYMTASLAASLASGQLLILVDFISSRVVCFVLASVSHFCWLAAFSWMTALAMLMTRTFFDGMATNTGKQSANEVRKKYKKCCIGGWGIPALLVGLLVVLDILEDSPFKVGYGKPLCGWMSQSYVFLVPVAVALAVNIICFLLTTVSIERTMRATRAALSRQQTSDGQRLLMYSKMLSIMGVTWIAGFLAAFSKVAALWWVYIVLNGLQGTFIAFSFVLNTRLLRFLKARWSAGNSTSGRGSGPGSENRTPRACGKVASKRNRGQWSGQADTTLSNTAGGFQS
ncbi:hypothetical protein ACOMHN_040345 [Nucella lapillus]